MAPYSLRVDQSCLRGHSGIMESFDSPRRCRLVSLTRRALDWIITDESDPTIVWPFVGWSRKLAKWIVANWPTTSLYFITPDPPRGKDHLCQRPRCNLVRPKNSKTISGPRDAPITANSTQSGAIRPPMRSHSPLDPGWPARLVYGLT